MSLTIIGANRHTRQGNAQADRRRVAALRAATSSQQQRRAAGEHLLWRTAHHPQRGRKDGAARRDDGVGSCSVSCSLSCSDVQDVDGRSDQAASRNEAKADKPRRLPSTLGAAADLLEGCVLGDLSAAEARQVCALCLSPNAARAKALNILRRLVEVHGYQCDAADARSAALLVGSLALLQLVLVSNPALSVVGMDVFDRRYPGQFKLNAEGRKHCLKALLARGAQLGDKLVVPGSKLLKKIEADAYGAWIETYFRSLHQAGLQFPCNVEDRVRSFLLHDV